MTAEVREVEQRMLRLYRLRDELDRQTDLRRRALDACAGGRGGRDVLRRELSERRALRRQVVRALEHDEGLLHRFRLLTEGAPAPLAVLLDLIASPTTNDDKD